jgi:hypothetical protein
MMGVTPLVQIGFSWHYSISDDFQELSSPQAIRLGFFLSVGRGDRHSILRVIWMETGIKKDLRIKRVLRSFFTLTNQH